MEIGGYPDVDHLEVAAIIDPVRREVAQLFGTKGDGGVGSNRNPQGPSAIRVEAGGDVQRVNEGGTAVGCLNYARVQPVDSPRQPSSKERIDDHVGGADSSLEPR